VPFATVSDVDTFSDAQRIFQPDTEIPHRTIHLRVAEQKPHGAQVAGFGGSIPCHSPHRLRVTSKFALRS